VPLSEDEERILTEIEQHLYASDPGLARQVGSTTVYTESLRGVRIGVAGMVVGLVLAIVLLPVHFLLSFFVGFGVMLISAWHFQRNLRRLGKAGFEQATKSLKVVSFRDYIANASDKARERFRHDEDDES
jgi:Protein of unknown function (DUF3040)